MWLLQNLVGQEICRRIGSQLHGRSEGDPKTNDMWQWGKCCFSLRKKKTTKATKTQWTVDVQVVVGGDGGPYVVMEHMPKPQQN